MTTILDVLPLLAEHLTVGEMARVKRATDVVWEPDVLHVISTRMRRRRCLPSWDHVCSVMSNGRHCRECGSPTACLLSICTTCSSDPECYFGMETRKTIIKRYGRLSKKLRVIKRGRTGCFFYWAKEVEQLFPDTRSVTSE